MMTQMTLRWALIAITSALLIGCSSEEAAETPSAAETAVDAEAALIERAMAIHRVLTLDSHADTPLRMIEPGFDMAERHDPRETGSKFDYPRMIEGGLDSVFFSAFVAQGIRTMKATQEPETLPFKCWTRWSRRLMRVLIK